MGRIRRDVRRLFRLDLTREDLATRQVDDEIALHIEARVEQLVARGLTLDEARVEAGRKFGDVDAARADVGHTAVRTVAKARWRDRLSALTEDLAYVIRSLRRSPGFTVTVVVSFALGIAANAAMFGIVNRLLLRGPEHVVDAANVRRLHARAFISGFGDSPTSTFGYISYTILRDQAHTVDRVAAYVSRQQYKLGKGTDGRQIEATLATWDFFPLLGVRPALGRFYTADEDRPPDGTPVVVISYDLWKSAFVGDTGVLGSSIQLSGKPYTIIGVAPERFTGPDLAPMDAWLPITLGGGEANWWTSWNMNWLDIIVRLRPGVNTAAVENEITALQQRNYSGPGSNPIAKARFFMSPLNMNGEGHEPAEFTVARWLTGVSVVVLLIASANVANLLLARVLRRRREVAVRLALGISRARLVRLLLSESLFLAAAGCALALLLAWWGGATIRALLLPYVWFPGGSLSIDVLLFSATMTVLVGTAVGLVPVFQARSLDLTHSLKAGSQQAGGARSAMQIPLLLAQSALSATLLIGAGLFLRSFQNARAVDLGFAPSRFVEAWLNFPHIQDSSLDAYRARMVREGDASIRVVERVRAMKGVEHAALAIGSPFGAEYSISLRVPGHDSIPTLAGGGPFTSIVTPGYFETVGIRLQHGRVFTPADRKQSERVAIVNETMARTLWPGKEALGQCIQVGFDPCSRIVGIVADARRHNLRELPVMQYYLPWGQGGGVSGSVVVVRPTDSPASFVPTLQRVVREVAGVPARASVKQDDIDPLAQVWRTGTLLFSIFGGLALVIAAIGLYSVIAYMVAQRTHEFGVRLALGASARQLIAMVLSRGVVVSCVGLAAGMAIALLAGGFLEPLLFETTAHDPKVLTGVAVVLLAVAVVACLVPARRAASVDAITALRAD
jgi:predicted permease